MIKVLYYWANLKEVWSDDEKHIEGYDTIKHGIEERKFETQEYVEEFLSDLSVSEGESEGHDHYVILAVYDKETGWYDRRYINKR